MSQPKPKSVYITGKVFGASIDELQEFGHLRDKLEAHGYQVTTAVDDLLDGDQWNDANGKNLYLDNRRVKLKVAEALVLLQSYQEDDEALKEIRIAMDWRKIVFSPSRIHKLLTVA